MWKLRNWSKWGGTTFREKQTFYLKRNWIFMSEAEKGKQYFRATTNKTMGQVIDGGVYGEEVQSQIEWEQIVERLEE